MGFHDQEGTGGGDMTRTLLPLRTGTRFRAGSSVMITIIRLCRSPDVIQVTDLGVWPETDETEVGATCSTSFEVTKEARVHVFAWDVLV